MRGVPGELITERAERMGSAILDGSAVTRLSGPTLPGNCIAAVSHEPFFELERSGAGDTSALLACVDNAARRSRFDDLVRARLSSTFGPRCPENVRAERLALKDSTRLPGKKALIISRSVETSADTTRRRNGAEEFHRSRVQVPSARRMKSLMRVISAPREFANDVIAGLRLKCRDRASESGHRCHLFGEWCWRRGLGYVVRESP